MSAGERGRPVDWGAADTDRGQDLPAAAPLGGAPAAVGGAFAALFERATGRSPYPYQERLATAQDLPELLCAPTGAGKTHAVLLAWLYRRRAHPDAAVRSATPRRLVYCLPMRVLVEQTRDVVDSALRALGWRHDGDPFSAPADAVGMHVIMGGEVDDDWELWPERDAVLVGTQDMLISRALNRGYGQSRYRWPMSFGLLNNDTLWVLDEVQLMGVGLPTTCQLEAFRRGWRTFGSSRTLWMSATVAPSALRTVDHDPPDAAFGLMADDRNHHALRRRLLARKPLRRANTALEAGGKNLDVYAASLAAEICQAHVAGTLTLVITNTIPRARAVYRALTDAPRAGKGKQGKAPAPTAAGPETLLLHSRFRPEDRARNVARLLAPAPPEGRIVVSTQVVEAGLDVSARTLFTELAPWPSLVQRFGRCNRAGELDAADVVWIDLESGDDQLVLPYDAERLDEARQRLEKLDAVGPKELEDLGAIALPDERRHVLRRRDLWELFDTTPDVSGCDLDVSLFVRDTTDHSLQVFWRELSVAGARVAPPRDLPRPHRDELCSAGVAEARDLLQRSRKRAENGWIWDPIDGAWVPVDPKRLRPGLILLLSAELGGYTPEAGFVADATSPVPPVRTETTGVPEEGADDDLPTFQRVWLPLTTHLGDVEREAEAIASQLAAVLEDGRWRSLLGRAGRWHDAGKAHPAFQDTLLRGTRDEAERASRASEIWAKSGGRIERHIERPRFRHELVSALALLAHADRVLADFPREDRDLVTYLVAAHHGRIRLGIRAVDGEKAPPEPGRRFALGVWEQDHVAETDLGDGHRMPETTLDLSTMELGEARDGQPSWSQRMLGQLERLGPFRLAFLEALLIAADRRASALAERREARRD